MRIEYALRHRDTLQREWQSLLDWTTRAELTSAQYLAERQARIFDSVAWLKSPQWVQTWLQGYERAIIERIDQQLTAFCYVVPCLRKQGKWVIHPKGDKMVFSIQCEDYRDFSPMALHEANFPSGSFWQADFPIPAADAKIYYLSERNVE